MKSLTVLRYQPLVPVAVEDFADATKRATWLREKGMFVF
jgi:hypothetical protein